MDSARRDIAWMGRLVEQLLSISRVESAPEPLAPVDLNGLGVEVVAALAPLAIMRGRELELEEVGAPTVVQGRWPLLFEALSNLTENALSHAPKDSTVTVRVGPGAGLHVLDRGAGVPEAERARIFQRFAQGSRPTSGGAGLGLAIVRDIMAGHGGRVAYADRPGGGAAFSLLFAGRDED